MPTDHQVTIIFLNWCCPSSISSSEYTAQANFLASVLHSGDRNIGMLMQPVWVYKRGSLWMAEAQALKTLANKGVHVDKTFNVLLKNKKDERDNRPMCYPGRLLLADHVKANDCFWRKSTLWNENATERAEQLQPKDMKRIEDLDPEALPSSIDSTDGVHGAKKFEQMGDNAMNKLLASMLDKVEFKERSAIVICDLSPGVGDMFQGYMQIRAAGNQNLYYYGVCSTGVHKDWCTKTWTQAIADQLKDKTLKLPGVTPKPDDPPDTVMEAAPPRPTLNLLTWQCDVENQPGRPSGVSIPKALMDQWYHHQTFGEKFKSIADDIIQTCGVEEHVGFKLERRLMEPSCLSQMLARDLQ